MLLMMRPRHGAHHKRRWRLVVRVLVEACVMAQRRWVMMSSSEMRVGSVRLVLEAVMRVMRMSD